MVVEGHVPLTPRPPRPTRAPGWFFGSSNEVPSSGIAVQAETRTKTHTEKRWIAGDDCAWRGSVE